jgi:hypothetical protein
VGDRSKGPRSAAGSHSVVDRHHSGHRRLSSAGSGQGHDAGCARSHHRGRRFLGRRGLRFARSLDRGSSWHQRPLPESASNGMGRLAVGNHGLALLNMDRYSRPRSDGSGCWSFRAPRRFGRPWTAGSYQRTLRSELAAVSRDVSRTRCRRLRVLQQRLRRIRASRQAPRRCSRRGRWRASRAAAGRR